MRTFALLLATSTLLAAATATASTTGRPAAPEIRLIEESSQARPGGGQRVRYTILQRIEPRAVARPAANGAPATTVSSGGTVGLSYEQDPTGWLNVGTIEVEHYGPNAGPHAAVTAAVAPAAATAASDASPAALPQALAIEPVRPDPVRGRELVVDVALPSAGPARLELMDVMGRRITARELGSLGAGRHRVDLGAGQRLAPGVYMLRLTQGSEARGVRVTVVD